MESEEKNNEPPRNEQADSETNDSQPSSAQRARQPRVPRRLRDQTNTPTTAQDDELKAQMRAARENGAATTVDPNESFTIPDEDQGPRVGDGVDVENLVSVPSTARRVESGVSETADARAAREPSIRSRYSNGRPRSFTKERDAPVPNGQQVGAVEVQERAFGFMPAWYGQSQESRMSMSSVEMIPINEQEEVDVLQPFDAEVSREFSLVEPTGPRHSVNFSNQSTSSMDITIVPEDFSVEDPSKKSLVPKAFCVFVVILAVVGAVIAGVIWKEKQEAALEIASTPITKTAAPTPVSIQQCSDFRDIDPLVQRMDVDTFDQYNLLLENVVQKLIPKYTSPEDVLEELCSPYHRALVWLASDALSKESFKVAENRYLLAFLFLSWKGDSWSEQRPWLSNATECDWLGIFCNESGQIVELHWIISKNLNDLSVTIPEEIGLLTDLTSLKLNVNFVGSVPKSIGNLINLSTLDLSSNFQLSGKFPYDDVVRLDKLRTLSLSDAPMLSFPQPAINHLSSLEYLDVARSQRSNQDLPTEIGNLVNLVVMSIRDTGANGPIPTELSRLTNLEYLNLGGNDNQGALVTEIGLLKNLSMLILDNNKITGQIPTEIGSVSRLATLTLEGNLISGALPHEIGNCTDLEYLSLSRTNIEEDLPTELFSLTNLTSLKLAEVLLGGSFPLGLFSLSNLETIDLAETLFTGNRTIDLSGLTSLECLDITDTDLSGTLVLEEKCRLDFVSSTILDECVAMQLDTCTCCKDQENCGGVGFRCQEDPLLFDRIPQYLKDRFL